MYICTIEFKNPAANAPVTILIHCIGNMSDVYNTEATPSIDFLLAPCLAHNTVMVELNSGV